jgi:anti-sigma-K factor RskA
LPDDPTIGVDERVLDDDALEALAEAYATAPPPALRQRLLAAARRADTGASMRGAVVRWRVVGTVAAGIALALGGLLARSAQQTAMREDQLAALARENQALGERVAAQERTVAGLRDSLAAQATVLRVLGGPRTLSASLAPQGGAAGSGRIVVDSGSGETAIVVAGLPALPQGKTYELWAIRGANPPEPAGLFTITGDRPAALRADTIARPAEVTAFAVSIEPAGGSTSPTGAVVLAGPVAS